MRDFAVEGSKLKAKPARQAAWYGKYKADIPGYRRMLAGLDKVTACTVVSLLGQHWTTELATLKSEPALCLNVGVSDSFSRSVPPFDQHQEVSL